MLEEADEVLEDWFAGGAEQSTLLRLLAGVGQTSNVVEIGCGLGRLALALRRVLTDGHYLGIDVVTDKIDFLLREMTPLAPHFRFAHVDVHSAFYNDGGLRTGSDLQLPCETGWADAIIAMSVFTHLLPNTLRAYLNEVHRMLRPGGSFLVSCFLLDKYHPGRPRSQRYSLDQFAFDHDVAGTAGDMCTSDPSCPEAMLAIRWGYFESLARSAGLTMVRGPLSGSWSGTADHWIMGQDLVVFGKPLIQFSAL